ncbi:RNA 3'-terminal phosphate cyclase [Massarina eburnea CBS 473.64]|uniref:RNA 3'-terminal phosphate cyclase n=1 Tax=Massarina eburnea CBS 473.64 TaxID=1395130 RepID=A0A6A6SFB2_9PLEO|nr:RNA 3'-terminal phosphate cyclase [Massarina eburnea CBS 473.64]
MATPIHLKGTTLEGGGQLLRLATCLSSLTSTPIHITSIRGNRSGGGGLKTQHLTSIQWLAQASDATVSGMNLKSTDIEFSPSGKSAVNGRGERGGDITIKQSTPGSVNLVFQAILPYILFAGSGSGEAVRVNITGGTNVSNSPSYDYVEQVLLPMLALIGIPAIEANVHSRGWSQGSTRVGAVTYTVVPLMKQLPAFTLTKRGDIKSIRATIVAPKAYEQQLRDELDVMFETREAKFFGAREPEVEVTFEDSQHEKRYYLLLVATTSNGVKLGRDWLYNHGVRAGNIDTVISTLVKKVSDDLLSEIEHGGCVDEYLRDQLIVFQALAKGRCEVYGGKKNDVLLEPSLHAQTAHWVAKEVISVDFNAEGTCEGIGFGDEQDKKNTVEIELAEGLQKLEV